MKKLVICSDCFGNNTDLLRTIEIDKSANLEIIKTHCMGICPKDKISTIYLEKNKVNEFKINSLTLNQIKDI
jgi:hypothetical protein